VLFVAPVYNEAENLAAFCEEWLPVVRARGRLLLVDDGSTDGSGELLDRLAARHPELEVLHQPNGGHGSAIMAGYRRAMGREYDWVFQVDSDRQFEPGDFNRLWALRDEADFVLGVREERHDHPIRILLSRGFCWLLGLLAGVRLRDPNSPFRLMRASHFGAWLARIPEKAFAPNVFVALEAARRPERFHEVSVRHRTRRAGSVSIRGWKILRIALRCAAELWRYRRAVER
jgi:dolichol-phosphate mannosyltransferase